LRSTNLARSRAFYLETLGFPAVATTDEAFIFLAGSTVIGVLAPDAPTANAPLESAEFGLDHIALGCDHVDEIARVASELTTAGVPNTGVKEDPATGKPYVAFDDPDGFIWELYLV